MLPSQVVILVTHAIFRQTPSVQRQPKQKLAPRNLGSIVDVLGCHTPAVRLDDRAAQAQANAHAVGLGGIKRFIQACHDFWGDAIATVLHGKFHAPATFKSRRIDLEFNVAFRSKPLSRINRLCRIAQQIDQDLFNQYAIDQERG